MIRTIVVTSTYAMANQMGSLLGHRAVGFQGGEGAAPRGGGVWQDIRRRTRPAVTMAAGRDVYGC